MHTRRDIVLWVVIFLCFMAGALSSATNTALPAPNRPAVTRAPTATVNPLSQQVTSQLNKLTFTPQGLCQFPQSQGQQFDLTIAQIFADLLKSPAAKSLGHQDLEKLFAGAMTTLRSRSISLQGESKILDEINGYLLVHLPRAYCYFSSHDHRVPGLYVFNRAGQFWPLTAQYFANARWIEDRWVGFTTCGIGCGSPIYSLAHIYMSGGKWVLQDDAKVSYGPNLLFDFQPDQYIAFKDGYRQLVVSEQATKALMGNPAPCDFGDNLSKLKQQKACADCDRIKFLNAIYSGTLTLEWQGTRYILTDKTPYKVTVILSDYTVLEDEAPTAAALAQDTYHMLRPESWRALCVYHF